MAEKKNTKVVTGACIASYVHTAEPESFNNSEPAYSIQLVINKSDTKTVSAIKEAIKNAYENGAQTLGNADLKRIKIPLRDGDEERSDDPVYKGRYFLNAKTKTKPEVVDRNGQAIIDEARDFYSGCICRASINFYAFNTSGNKGIGVGLNNVQKLADGTPLGGRTRAADDFGDDASGLDLGGYGDIMTESNTNSGGGYGSEDEDWLS